MVDAVGVANVRGMTDAVARRGRPRSIDPESLARGALEIIAERGYDEVTMTDVATGLGVSVRTLHRHFPSKSDIVWGGVDTSFQHLADALASVDPSLTLLEAIETAVVALFEHEDARSPRSRARLRAIASMVQLHTARPAPSRHWHEQLLTFAAERLNTTTDDLRARAIAAAVQSATLDALSWWAAHDEEIAPQEAVRLALRSLRDPGA